MRDSAGIRIVENWVPAGTALRLESTPTIDIGPADGPHGEFTSSPISAVRQQDGSLAVMAWATTEFRLFDARGQWTRTVGRDGEGPGEFEALGFLFLGGGDILLSFEPGARRVQRWTPEGTFAGLEFLTPPPGVGGGWMKGVFGDGALLLTRSRPDQSRSTELTTGGSVLLQRVSPSRVDWDSLFTYAGPRSLRHIQNPEWGYASPLFEPEPSISVRGQQIAFATGDRFEIEIRSEVGELVMLVRRETPPRIVSSAERERAIVAWEAERLDTIHRLMLPRLRSASERQQRPAVSTVHLTADGGVWAVYGDPVLGEEVRASVFDKSGRWQTDLVVPGGLQILQIDDDGVLGTATDTDGFRHIQFYRFVRD